MFWILVSVALLLLFYWKAIRPTSYWRKKGVKQSDWVLPIFGDVGLYLLKKAPLTAVYQHFYDTYSRRRYAGIYHMNQPLLQINDPELLKQITVKDFDHFTDHMKYLDEDIDPMWSKNLVALTGERWRQMRSKLSPAFTGSKMKLMFPLMEESAKQVVQYLSEFKDSVVELEMRDTFTRYTNDVIANCAFGVKCDSLKDKENEFYLMGTSLANFQGVWKFLKFGLYSVFPPIAKILDVSFYSMEIRKFFTGLISTAIEHREKNNIVRQDMIHLLMQANKGLLKNDQDDQEKNGSAPDDKNEPEAQIKMESLSVEDITAQALIFFVAGFESVAAFMSFLAYELAINVDVQERLRAEIEDTLKQHGGQLTYEAVNSIKYFDMVISESLRKWSPNPIANRTCTKPYILKAKLPNEVDVRIDVGVNLVLPNFAMHYDPKYFPDPHKFDPERFSEERKGEIQPGTYFPFGLGPRTCIGSRFALLEAKIVFIYLLRKFEFVPVARTLIPMKLKPIVITITAEGGTWIGFKPRK